MSAKLQMGFCTVQKVTYVLKQDCFMFANFQNRFQLRFFHLNITLKDSKGHNLHNENLDPKPFKGSDEHTWVGPPDELSNLRLKVFPQSKKMTDEEKDFYTKCKETQEWNQQYWEDHNRDFQKSRKSFIDKLSTERNLPKDEPLTIEEMSQFYKNFLDSNHKKHIAYNWNWYKKNFNLLFLAAKANFSKFKKFFKN